MRYLLTALAMLLICYAASAQDIEPPPTPTPDGAVTEVVSTDAMADILAAISEGDSLIEYILLGIIALLLVALGATARGLINSVPAKFMLQVLAENRERIPGTLDDRVLNLLLTTGKLRLQKTDNGYLVLPVEPAAPSETSTQA